MEQSDNYGQFIDIDCYKYNHPPTQIFNYIPKRSTELQPSTNNCKSIPIMNSQSLKSGTLLFCIIFILFVLFILFILTI